MMAKLSPRWGILGHLGRQDGQHNPILAKTWAKRQSILEGVSAGVVGARPGQEFSFPENSCSDPAPQFQCCPIHGEFDLEVLISTTLKLSGGRGIVVVAAKISRVRFFRAGRM